MAEFFIPVPGDWQYQIMMTGKYENGDTKLRAENQKKTKPNAVVGLLSSYMYHCTHPVQRISVIHTLLPNISLWRNLSHSILEYTANYTYQS